MYKLCRLCRLCKLWNIFIIQKVLDREITQWCYAPSHKNCFDFFLIFWLIIFIFLSGFSIGIWKVPTKLLVKISLFYVFLAYLTYFFFKLLYFFFKTPVYKKIPLPSDDMTLNYFFCSRKTRHTVSCLYFFHKSYFTFLGQNMTKNYLFFGISWEIQW